MGRLKRAFQATVVTQSFVITAMLLSLVTVPLYLQWLGQERYGVLLTGMAFGSYLMFADVGLSWASMLLISQAKGRRDNAEIAAIVRTSVFLVSLAALFVCLVVVLFFIVLSSSARPAWIPGHEEAAGLVVAIGASVLVSLLVSPFYSVLVGMQEMHLASLYQGIARVLGVLASVAAAALSAPLGLVFGANVACTFIVSILAAMHCMRRHPWAFQCGCFWDREQVRLQLRTGAKSFMLQVGNVFSGTAPVLAVSTFAGASYVPLLSVPLTLLTMPLSVLYSFNASLQSGYGEAISRNEEDWIAGTIRSILSVGLVFIGLLTAGFIVLAQPFILIWSGGHLHIPSIVLVSVLSIAISGALLGVFRFSLSGMNRHRTAGMSEFASGLLSLLFTALAVHIFGFAWVGLGVLAAVLATSGWILPRDVKHTLSQTCPWVERRLLVMLLVATGLSAGLGQFVLQATHSYNPVLAILFSGLVITGAYACFIYFICPVWWNEAKRLKQQLLSSSTQPSIL